MSVVLELGTYDVHGAQSSDLCVPVSMKPVSMMPVSMMPVSIKSSLCQSGTLYYYYYQSLRLCIDSLKLVWARTGQIPTTMAPIAQLPLKVQ